MEIFVIASGASTTKCVGFRWAAKGRKSSLDLPVNIGFDQSECRSLPISLPSTYDSVYLGIQVLRTRLR